MTDIDRQFKGNLGMFLVCAELSKLNLVAMPTSRNTKGYDIVVLDPKTNAGAAIQVKCTDQPQKGFPILTSHWKDYQAKVEEKIMSDFVFVDISDPAKPTYFIVAREKLKRIVKSLIEQYTREYQQKHSLTWQQMLEKEQKEKRKPDLWVIRLGDIKAYRDNWDAIKKRLYLEDKTA